MAKVVYNTKTKNYVPYCPGLDVEGNPNLEWRDVPARELVVFDSVVEAIASLDKHDPAHFTKSGLPDARVLAEKLGRVVTKAERDEAWADYKKGQGI